MSRHHKKGTKKKQNNRRKQEEEEENDIIQQLKEPNHQQEAANPVSQLLKNEENIEQKPLGQKSVLSPKQEIVPSASNERSFKKARIPHFLILNSQIIEEERLGIKQQARKIKKIFLDLYQQAERSSLLLRKAIYSPLIFLEYKTQISSTKQYIFLRDIIRQSHKDFKDHKQKIHSLYLCLYDQLPTKFKLLTQFGIQKARQKHIKLNYKFNRNQGESNLVVYYCWDRFRKDVNFTVIDKHLNIVDFQGYSLYSYRQYEAELQLYEQFMDYLSKRDSGEGFQLDEEQEEGLQWKEIVQQPTEDLKQKLNRFIEKDFQTYYEDIQEKQRQVLSLWNEVNSEETQRRIQKLNEQIIYTRLGIQHYNQQVKQIKMVKKGMPVERGYSFYSSSIKRLIMAEKQIDSRLPILQKRKEIAEKLSNQSIILIQGETGSGKSTQIPQILCKYFNLFEDANAKPILVSQPRRLATRTLAERVAFEMGEKIGKFVDFKTSIDRQVSSESNIIFKLDRLILDQLTQDPVLSKYSALVIDEAHERTISIDVIIGLVKKLVKERSDFRVIITSASMDVELFQRYFEGIKALKVSGRLYEVNIFYRPLQIQNSTQKIKKILDEEIISQKTCLKDPFCGHILIFCNGISQITELVKYYTSELNPNRFQILPLHGKILPEEQRKVFNPSKKHKLIFASRIAQTAITIDDVRVVIDPGQDFQLVYNQSYKFSCMRLRPISQSSAKQRAGRAGRTAPGFCFRLYTKQNFMSRPLGKIPQIENSSLQTVVLRLKSLQINNIIDFPYISPPSQHALLQSIETLKLLEALDSKTQQITAIGSILLYIPIQPVLARAIVQSLFIVQILKDKKQLEKVLSSMSKEQVNKIQENDIRQCIIEILSMVVNSSNLFNIGQDDKNQSDLNKFSNFPLKEGDFHLLKSLYKQFKHISDTLGQRSQLRFWLDYFFLNKKALKQVRDLENELKKLTKCYIELSFSELTQQLDTVKLRLKYCKTYNDILMVSLISSFLPNLCRYSGNPEIGYTLVSQRKPIQIYGSSSLSLVGLSPQSPQWILAYDLYTNQRGRFYCKIAQEIDISFLQKIAGDYAWQKFNLINSKNDNPYYQKIISEALPSKILSIIKTDYILKQRGDKRGVKVIFDGCTPIFDDFKNHLSVYRIIQGNQNKLEECKYVWKKYLFEVQSGLQEDNFMRPYLGNTKVVFDRHFKVMKIQKIIQKDLLFTEMESSQKLQIRQIIKQINGDLQGVNIIRGFSSLKIRVQEQFLFRSLQKNFQKYAQKRKTLQSRINFKCIPRNQRNSSQSKVLLTMTIQNPLNDYFDNPSKYFQMLQQFINKTQKDHKLKKIHEWKELIEDLLIRVSINPEECVINVWSDKQIDRKKSKFIECLAEISNIEGGVYSKLMQLSNPAEYLQCQEVYIREVFQQTVAFPSEKVFGALKEEYIQQIVQLKKKYKRLSIVDRCIQLKNKQKVKIIAKSQNRQELWQAQTKIGQIFAPHLVQLTERQAYYLQSVDRFASLQRLQNDFKYKICLQSDSGTHKLYLYCCLSLVRDVTDRIKELLKETTQVTRQISYKNKCLADMVTKIQQRKTFLKNNTKKKFTIQYEIKFKNKILLITANQQQHWKLQQKFAKLQSTIKKQCPLCNNRLTKPYKLIGCLHEACRHCLLSFLDSIIYEQKDICCPLQGCKSLINIRDIESILGESRFERISDQRVIQFAGRQQRYELCQRCHYISQQKRVKGEPCNICGYANRQK